jgi:MFS family permease
VFESVVTGPGIFGVFALVFLIFPNGRPLTPRWRVVTIVAMVSTLGAMLGSGLSPGTLNNVTYNVQNPFGNAVPSAVAGALDSISFIILLASMVAGAFSLVLRFRRSRGDERQQLKWVTTAVAFAAVLLLSGPLFWFSVIPAPFVDLWGPVFVIAAVIIPASMGIAMLKYRLYDIDVIINRALVYGPLTVAIAAVYVGGVIGLQALSRAAVGQHSDLAIAIVTLAVAALFNPLRRRLQLFVDRRFYRHKYDAARTLAALSTRLRDEVDLDQMAGELAAVIQETMQPASVSLWLREGQRT